jgi:Domain of unknown function (DUF5666)
MMTVYLTWGLAALCHIPHLFKEISMASASTSTSTSFFQRHVWLLASASAAALIAACGGGGGGGADSGTTTAVTPPAVTATHYALGPVSGFGSVIVAGVRYDDSQASVSDEDGQSLPSSAVKLGVMLQIDASKMDVAAGTAKAERLRLGTEVVGPVSAVNVGAGTVQVLGQTVVVNASTVFDSSLSGGLAALAVGAVIEVHGIPDAASGQITATRIEPETGALFFRLRGAVTALNTTAKTFKIGAATISYGSIAAGELPSSLANNLVVRVRVQTTPVAGVWVATSVRSGVRAPVAGQGARVEGTITAFTSANVFEVAGLKVDASAATFPDGTVGLLLGARVHVTGTVTNGVLVATQVDISGRGGEGGNGNGNGNGSDPQRPLELHGAIISLDSTAKTFMLRNVTVSYSGAVVYKNGSESKLAKDATVEVYGVLSADRTRLQATRIEFKP